jgi:tRNA(fMet)-specific endonuclease VapC
LNRYMLDTNTCIYIIKYHGSSTSLYARMSTISPDDVAISSIVAAELWYGVALSKKKRPNELALKEFLAYAEVLDWPKGAAIPYSQIRAGLRVKGTPIGTMDLLIAAHAVSLNAILVTDNTAKFQRVPGLRLENWIER